MIARCSGVASFSSTMPRNWPSSSRTMRPKPAGFGLRGRAQQAGRPAGGKLGQQRPQRRNLHHRRVAGQDQHRPVDARPAASRHIITAWPVPSCSVCSANSTPGSPASSCRTKSRPIADDDDDPLDARRPHGVDHVADHRPAAHRHQHLGQVGRHPLAFARGQDDCERCRRHIATAIRECKANPSDAIYLATQSQSFTSGRQRTRSAR